MGVCGSGSTHVLFAFETYVFLLENFRVLYERVAPRFENTAGKCCLPLKHTDFDQENIRVFYDDAMHKFCLAMKQKQTTLHMTN